MNKLIVIAVLSVCMLTSCKSVRLTTEEKRVIGNGDGSLPFRVLTISNRQDSVLLRTKSANVNFAKDKALIEKLIDRLLVTMKEKSGVGIAAPQVGLSRNIFIFTRIDKPGRPIEAAINPKIVSHSDSTVCFVRDGCLSIPGKSANTVRYKWVEVEYLNRNGQFMRERLTGYSRTTDFTGIVFQHEFDHLNGILYIDKIYQETK